MPLHSVIATPKMQSASTILWPCSCDFSDNILNPFTTIHLLNSLTVLYCKTLRCPFVSHT